MKKTWLTLKTLWRRQQARATSEFLRKSNDKIVQKNLPLKVNSNRYSCRLRSKSIISEDFKMTARDNDRNYPLRRQSAISDFKPKVKFINGNNCGNFTF